MLGGCETDASEAARHLAELRARRELLCSALQAAEQAEIDARDALSAKDFATRKRAWPSTSSGSSATLPT